MNVTCKNISIKHPPQTNVPANPLSLLSGISEPRLTYVSRAPAHLEGTWGLCSQSFQLSLHCTTHNSRLCLSRVDFWTGQTNRHPLTWDTLLLLTSFGYTHRMNRTSFLHSSYPHHFTIPINWLAIPRAFQVPLNKRFLLPRSQLQLHTDLGMEKVPLFKNPAVAIPSETINAPAECRGV